MASRTQLVCLCEGLRGRSIDPVFINRLIRQLKPAWLRSGSGSLRIRECGNRKEVICALPDELKGCVSRGSTTTLMVWADCDNDCADPDALREVFWRHAKENDVSSADFDRVVFIFAKDRLENWIEFLTKGKTDERVEGQRVDGRNAATAADVLAKACLGKTTLHGQPASLAWSCGNWKKLCEDLR